VTLRIDIRPLRQTAVSTPIREGVIPLPKPTDGVVKGPSASGAWPISVLSQQEEEPDQQKRRSQEDGDAKNRPHGLGEK
jgi:hypothetical protein